MIRKTNQRRAVAYLRMSSDAQADSPQKQRAGIEYEAKTKNSELVDEWDRYRDDGISGTTGDRPGFKLLLADAKRGLFDRVYLWESSRLSREDPIDVLNHYRDLDRAGVQIWIVGKGPIDTSDIGGLIQTVIGSHQNRQESVTLARRVVEGKHQKAKQGYRVSGHGCFGYDKIVVDPETGKQVQRVHFREACAKSSKHRVRLDVSKDKQAVQAVRDIFKAVADGSSLRQVAIMLNRRGVVTRGGNRWDNSAVVSVVRNPTYKGELHAGRWGAGKFYRIGAEGYVDGDGGKRPAPEKRGAVVVENAHPAIVSAELWARANDALERRPKRERVRTYLLSGLLRCKNCGYPMYGSKNIYRCCTGVPGEACGSAVMIDKVDEAVLQVLTDEVLTADREQRIRAEAHRQVENESSGGTIESLEKQVAKLARKLERSYEAIAEAETTDERKALRKLASQVRSESEAAEASLAGARSKADATAGAANTIKLLREKFTPERLKKASTATLRLAIQQTLEVVTLYWPDQKQRHGRHRGWERRAIVVKLRAEIGGQEIPVDLPGNKRGGRRRMVLQVLQEMGGNPRLKDIAERAGITQQAAWRVLQTAIASGEASTTGDGRYSFALGVSHRSR